MNFQILTNLVQCSMSCFVALDTIRTGVAYDVAFPTKSLPKLFIRFEIKISQVLSLLCLE